MPVDSMRHIAAMILGLAICGAVSLDAYERYSQNDDATWCRECHAGDRPRL